jgi:hypothetical protein
MSGNEIIRSAFAPLAGLPCWQALGEFGTYLTFHFGVPKVDVTEPTESIRFHRLTGVQGQYVLRLEAYQWVAFQDGARLAKSESPRDVIRKTAGTLQGQKLIQIALRIRPAGGEFLFDLGGRVAYEVRDPVEETLWTLCTRLDPDPDDVNIVSFTAAGMVSLFTLRGTADEPRKYVQETKEWPVEGETLDVRLDTAATAGSTQGSPSDATGPAGLR